MGFKGLQTTPQTTTTTMTMTTTQYLLFDGLAWLWARLTRTFYTPPAVALGMYDLRILTQHDFRTDSQQSPMAFWTAVTLKDDLLTVPRDYSFFVSKLQWFKNRKGFQHEFVVATIFHSKDLKNPIYLRFEHRLAPSDMEDQELSVIIGDEDRKVLSATQLMILHAALKAEFSNVAFGFPVYVPHRCPYSVIRVKTPSKLLGFTQYETAQLLATQKFPPNYHLRNLAMIVEKIFAEERSHSPAIHETYWFAAVFMRTAQALCPKMEEGAEVFVPTSAFDQAGKLCIKGIRTLKVVNAHDIPNAVEEVKDARSRNPQRKASWWVAFRESSPDEDNSRIAGQSDASGSGGLSATAEATSAEAT